MSRYPIVAALALASALTIILTWPQALHFGSQVAAHDDPFLSMWRVAWIAHTVPGHVDQLVDGNIFWPHERTLAYSDVTLLEGLLGTPLLWAGVRPPLIYNVLLFIGFIASGVGMFVLVRHLTGHIDAALVATAVFTLAPYRIEHFMHLELQWTMWMPLTFWAVHRVFESGSIRFGIVTGLLLCLQLLSCVYYGAFLGMMVGVLCVLLAANAPDRIKGSIGPLAVAAAMMLVLAFFYAQPYLENSRALGTRNADEIGTFSARLASYVTAPRQNWWWGWTGEGTIGNELHLFPGLAPLILAGLALVFRRDGRTTWIYAAMAAVATALSLGTNGPVYRWLLNHVWALYGFRAPARFAILAYCALAVLAAIGFAALEARVPPARRRALVIGTLAILAVEAGSAPLRLTEVPARVPDIYRYLKTVERGVVIELPIVDWNLAPDYMYWSTFHWQPLVNGYSGYLPADYVETLSAMEDFPDDRAIDRLRELKVRYVIVHEAYYKQKDFAAMMVKLLRRRELVANGRYHDVTGDAHLFELR